MRYFDVSIEVKEEDKEWAMEVGDNITTPAWSLRPYLLTAERDIEDDNPSHRSVLTPEILAAEPPPPPPPPPPPAL